ncbi:YdeI/OmpD-associated family protein [Daejeonella oryzae]|uniref:YdeI/OmpD-associated family protein n=1 Tax=Daejeonella oryzae TaxID=1122943 RepID=UPI0003FACE20|nr:YdeI/OmpD-associated family protein [Daejeonella oryzae]
MEESKLTKKLGIKPGHQILLVNAPADYEVLLNPIPKEAKIFKEAENQYDVIQLFVLNQHELQRDLIWIEEYLRPDTLFWITYPKKSSGILSDLEMMKSWEETKKYGLRGVAAVSVNESWTALRFRPSAQVKKSELCNSEIENNPLGQFIDVKNRLINLPPFLESVLKAQPKAKHFFETLSYTNKKEYVSWVLTARQEKTKTQRIQKMVEKLLAGKKNPSEK